MIGRIFFVCLFVACGHLVNAQYLQLPSPHDIREAPQWAREMYQPSPNVHTVDRLYRDYYRNHPFVKSYHTQFYKRWRRAVAPYLQPDGSAQVPDAQELERQMQSYLALRASDSRTGGGGWELVGPQRVYDNNIDFRANHSNVFSLTRSEANPNVLYAGTEPGEVYRSSNGGSSWLNVSHDFPVLQGVRAVAASPSDPDLVLAGTSSYLRRSTNGGQSWNHTYLGNSFGVNEILFHPGLPQLVWMAGESGLRRSTDAGQSWTTVYNDRCFDIKVDVSDSSRLYLLKHNPGLNICQFLMSTDTGQTFTAQTTGWYASSDPNRNTGGGRLAVSKSDSSRIYAYLIGEAKAGDAGFIGVYRSDDRGLSWTLPNGPAGGPYSTAHPNLAIGTPTWIYHQGFYNCALMASNDNPDEILIGGLNLWRSTDAGATFSVVSGYQPGPLNMHVDNQDFRAFGNEYWITTDGGIYRSTDFFQTQPQVMMNGIHSSDYWGFGTGWNEDVLVGGLYHNGNLAWHEAYQNGNFLSLGGGEAPTGYVNPGDNRKTFFSDIGGRYLPLVIGDPVANLPFGQAPNEAYWSASSSELEWHPHCYNIGWLGRENKLWKTDNGGITFQEVFTFGSNPNHDVTYIEVGSSDPEVMYVAQSLSSGNGAIWKTTDGGTSWTSLSLPGNTNKSKILLSLDMENTDHLWLAYGSGGNGQKIYESVNGGQSWTNRTTSMLMNQTAHSMFLVQGTNNGVYYASQNAVYYKDNNLNDWQLYSAGLPTVTSTDIARPFYRDGKLRIATYGRGVWENGFHTPPGRPIARIMVDAFSKQCEGDTFYFADHSTLNHQGASWYWDFANGNPASSNQVAPRVLFNGIGSHLVTLTVTDSAGNFDIDSMWVEITGIPNDTLAEGFENGFAPTNWKLASTGSLNWSLATNAGGYGASPSCAVADNFNMDAAGTWAELRAPVNLQWMAGAELVFDVAYVPYGGQYSDTLEVLISTDCGQTGTSVYLKGGTSLATAPPRTTFFIPNAFEWRKDTIDLSAFQGNPSAEVIFRNRGRFGNALYLDNILLNGQRLVSASEPETRAFAQLAPNPVPNGAAVRLVSNLQETFDLNIWNAEGKLVYQQKSLTPGQTVSSGLSTGVYFYELKGESLWERSKMVVYPLR